MDGYRAREKKHGERESVTVKEQGETNRGKKGWPAVSVGGRLYQHRQEHRAHHLSLSIPVILLGDLNVHQV